MDCLTSLSMPERRGSLMKRLIRTVSMCGEIGSIPSNIILIINCIFP